MCHKEGLHRDYSLPEAVALQRSFDQTPLMRIQAPPTKKKIKEGAAEDIILLILKLGLVSDRTESPNWIA
jgi:hypothetical protein